MLKINGNWIILALRTQKLEDYYGKKCKSQCFWILICTKTCNPNPWEGSLELQEALPDPQSLMLGLQMALQVLQVLQALQGILAVQVVPELVMALLGSSGVQSGLQVLRVPRNVHHTAAEEEPVGGHHIVEAPLEPEVPQDTLGQRDPLDKIEQEAPLWVFVGGSQIESCLLDREEDLQESAKEHQVLQTQQGRLQGEE